MVPKSQTSAGILIIAFLVSAVVHTVQTKLVPRSYFSYLNGPETDITPNSVEYDKKCGEKSDGKHPCFSNWGWGLRGVYASWGSRLLVKDGKQDFTLEDPTEEFTIEWNYYGSPTMHYSNFNPETGCYDVTLSVSSTTAWGRIWGADDDNSGHPRDIDTLHHEETKGTFCTKWFHVHAGKDGRGM